MGCKVSWVEYLMSETFVDDAKRELLREIIRESADYMEYFDDYGSYPEFIGELRKKFNGEENKIEEYSDPLMKVIGKVVNRKISKLVEGKEKFSEANFCDLLEVVLELRLIEELFGELNETETLFGRLFTKSKFSDPEYNSLKETINLANAMIKLWGWVCKRSYEGLDDEEESIECLCSTRE